MSKKKVKETKKHELLVTEDVVGHRYVNTQHEKDSDIVATTLGVRWVLDLPRQSLF